MVENLTPGLNVQYEGHTTHRRREIEEGLTEDHRIFNMYGSNGSMMAIKDDREIYGSRAVVWSDVMSDRRPPLDPELLDQFLRIGYEPISTTMID